MSLDNGKRFARPLFAAALAVTSVMAPTHAGAREVQPSLSSEATTEASAFCTPERTLAQETDDLYRGLVMGLSDINRGENAVTDEELVSRIVPGLQGCPPELFDAVSAKLSLDLITLSDPEYSDIASNVKATAERMYRILDLTKAQLFPAERR